MFYLGCLMKKFKEDGSIDWEKFILNYVISYLVDLMGVKVYFCDEIIGDKVIKMAVELFMGEIFVLENICFNEGEKKGDEVFVKSFFELVDFYVNDVFGIVYCVYVFIIIVV